MERGCSRVSSEETHTRPVWLDERQEPCVVVKPRKPGNEDDGRGGHLKKKVVKRSRKSRKYKIEFPVRSLYGKTLW